MRRHAWAALSTNAEISDRDIICGTVQLMSSGRADGPIALKVLPGT
jgi:hypothetical protein